MSHSPVFLITNQLGVWVPSPNDIGEAAKGKKKENKGDGGGASNTREKNERVL